MWSIKEVLSFLDDNPLLLSESKHGLEKESLRVDSQGKLSKKTHPRSLGSPLTNYYISTDFSEAQLELCTPPFKSSKKALEFLNRVHQFVIRHMGHEYLWPSSSPCILPSANNIPLAQYGISQEAEEKTLYRMGLGHRYGRKMQTMSGIHYNFSFSKDLWQALHKKYGKKNEIGEFISENYLRTCRNFLRFGWLNSYLFGVSSVVDKSYIEKPHPALTLMGNHSYYGKYATSIRMSELGYYSKVQGQLAISFNNLHDYIKGLEQAVTIPSSKFSKIGLFKNGKRQQINDHILQIEAEYYSRIRPKPLLDNGTRVVDALKKSGVEYLEVRTEDVTPFYLDGISECQLNFIEVFLYYCLLEKSENLTLSQEREICQNQNKVALYGRKPSLKLLYKSKRKALKTWGCELLKKMLPIAFLLDSHSKEGQYTKAIKWQIEKMSNSNLTPSARIIEKLKKENVSFVSFCLSKAKTYKKEWEIKKKPLDFDRKIKKSIKKSLSDQTEIEIYDEFYLRGYEDLEISTQLIIKEAFKRGVDVEIIDRKENFLLLRKGKKEELVKQATKTRLDSYITFLSMENKEVTKELLTKKGIRVPKGNLYYSKRKALDNRRTYQGKIVIKPNFSNFGLGISMIDPNNKNLFAKGVEKAFQHSNAIIIEEFCEGDEYRFLVIDNKVKAICLREPPKVIADGKLSIEKLIDDKNEKDKSVKLPEFLIQKGAEEKAILHEQGLNFKSVPIKGKEVFLRRTSNVSTGGDSIDMTDSIHKDYRNIATKAVKTVDAAICGVDMIIKNPKVLMKSDNHAILELNFNPALFLHRYPVRGKKRFVEKDILNVLGF